MLVGQILSLLLVATVLAVVGAVVVASLYRASMKRLMRATLPVSALEVSAPSSPKALNNEVCVCVTASDNQSAYRRLLVSFVLLTLVISLSRTLISQIAANAPITPKTVTALGLAYAWPVLPVLAVIGRWSRWRFTGMMVVWVGFAVLLLSWRTNKNVTFDMIVSWMVFDVVPPMLVVTALFLGNATRAVGPWLAPLVTLFVASSLVGWEVLNRLMQTQSQVVLWLFNWLNANQVIALFAVSPWLVAWWPARALGRWMGRAYRERRISELFYLFTAVWVIALVGPALGDVEELGWGALIHFSPLIWIGVGARLMQSFSQPRPTGRPPTLLVLRVFQQDRNAQDLFDRVIERWRLTGNTVLIAGTDLLERTMDAEDIFTFMDGRLAERFIHSPEDVPRRLADFEWQPDVEGRFRVNECYCHDTTWQQALVELIHISDVVLMDLRNFVEQNKGCLHELQVLAWTPGLRRVVVLVNDQTQLIPAQAAVAKAPDGRFVWLKQIGDTPLTTTEVLAPLFADAPTTAH